MVKENLKYHFYMQAKFLTSVQRETSQQHIVPELEHKKIHHSTQLSFVLSNGEKNTEEEKYYVKDCRRPHI